MTTIRIRQREVPTETSNASLSFDGGEEFSVQVTDPFSKEEEELLGWYFEEYVVFPDKGATAQQAAASVPRYGEKLFGQLFASPEAYARYKTTPQSGITEMRFEVAGSPEFHRFHWEALKDPKLPDAFVLHTTMVRKNLVPQTLQAQVKDSPTINVMLIVARPHGRFDVGYRTISRPLVECLRKADLRVQVDIVRPGTYEALSKQLERHGEGHYHIVHFDVHGALLTHAALKREVRANRLLYQSCYGRSDIPEYEGQKAFLALEGTKEGQGDPVEAGEVANLLLLHQVPAIVLNACQSGKQVGDRETSLGSRLLQAGAQTVVAMGHSVTVTAARIMMEKVYRELFASGDPPTAIECGRRELHNRKGRQARFNQTIDLEDWLLPVAYENRPVELSVRDFTPEESKDYYERQATRYRAPEPQYGFSAVTWTSCNSKNGCSRSGTFCW